jgi:hypothetical protein
LKDPAGQILVCSQGTIVSRWGDYEAISLGMPREQAVAIIEAFGAMIPKVFGSF